MMNLSRLTADGLIKAAIQRSKVDSSDPDALLQKVITEMVGEADLHTVEHAGYLNAIRDGIERLKRITAQAEQDFVQRRQMDIFGVNILEHKVPKRMLQETVAEVDDWMSQRAEMEEANAEDVDRAATAQRQRAARFRIWAEQVHRVREAVEAAGHDPAVMTYAEATKKTEAV